MYRTALILNICLVSFLYSQTQAQTDIYGGLIGNTTWTTAGSPYVIHGDISIQNGATLTIEPGVHVEISSQDITFGGKDLSLTEIIVLENASLVAEGLQTDSIIFSLIPGSQADDLWYGIEAVSGSSLTMQYTSITNTHTALLLGQVVSSNLENCQISDVSNLGLDIQGNSGTAISINNLIILK